MVPLPGKLLTHSTHPFLYAGALEFKRCEGDRVRCSAALTTITDSPRSAGLPADVEVCQNGTGRLWSHVTTQPPPHILQLQHKHTPSVGPDDQLRISGMHHQVVDRRRGKSRRKGVPALPAIS
jgi:hypothetical protein